MGSRAICWLGYSSTVRSEARCTIMRTRWITLPKKFCHAGCLSSHCSGRIPCRLGPCLVEVDARRACLALGAKAESCVQVPAGLVLMSNPIVTLTGGAAFRGGTTDSFGTTACQCVGGAGGGELPVTRCEFLSAALPRSQMRRGRPRVSPQCQDVEISKCGGNCASNPATRRLRKVS